MLRTGRVADKRPPAAASCISCQRAGCAQRSVLCAVACSVVSLLQLQLNTLVCLPLLQVQLCTHIPLSLNIFPMAALMVADSIQNPMQTITIRPMLSSGCWLTGLVTVVLAAGGAIIRSTAVLLLLLLAAVAADLQMQHTGPLRHGDSRRTIYCTQVNPDHHRLQQ